MLRQRYMARNLQSRFADQDAAQEGRPGGQKADPDADQKCRTGRGQDVPRLRIEQTGTGVALRRQLAAAHATPQITTPNTPASSAATIVERSGE